MADVKLLERLLNTLGDPQGRKKWLDHKRRARLVDLSGADLSRKDLRGYDFSDAILSTAIFLEADLNGADFSDAELQFADLRRASLKNCCMDRANLGSASLQGSLLIDVALEHANLAGAQLGRSDLIGSDLSSADLTGADLRGASLRFTRLTAARLDGADVAEADLTGCVMDDEAPARLRNFDRATIDDRAYRVMKSRLLAATTTEVIAPPAPTSPAERPPPRRRDRPERASRRPPRVEPVRPPAAAEASLEADVFAFTATEADLATEAGCYRILGIEVGTPLAGVAKAFRIRAKRLHPDMVLRRPPEEQAWAREQFYLVRQAYEKLTQMRAKPMTHLRWHKDVPYRDSPYDYSVEEYLKLAEVNPGNPDVLYNLAWKYFDAGLLEEAIRTYEIVCHLAPDDEDAQYNLRVVKLWKTFELGVELGANG